MASMQMQLFAQDLLDKAGLLSRQPSDVDDIVALADIIEHRLALFVLSSLSEEQLQEYNTLLAETSDPTQGSLFLKKHIPHFAIQRDMILKEFADEFLIGAEQVEKMID